MAGLLDGIMEQLGSDGVTQIAQSLGAEQDAMGSAVSAALPAISDDVLAMFTGR